MSKPNPAFEWDAAEARRPSTLRWAQTMKFTLPIIFLLTSGSSIAEVPVVDERMQPKYLLTACQEVPSEGKTSAMNGIDPAGWLAVELGNRSNRDIFSTAISNIKISMLEGTKHGKIFAEIDNKKLTSYHYDPIPGYEGKDKAIFIAEFEGKRYKVVINIIVSMYVDENTPLCPPNNTLVPLK